MLTKMQVVNKYKLTREEQALAHSLASKVWEIADATIDMHEVPEMENFGDALMQRAHADTVAEVNRQMMDPEAIEEPSMALLAREANEWYASLAEVLRAFMDGVAVPYQSLADANKLYSKHLDECMQCRVTRRGYFGMCEAGKDIIRLLTQLESRAPMTEVDGRAYGTTHTKWLREPEESDNTLE